MQKTILIIGTLDTKGPEFDYLQNMIHQRGLKTLLMDVGVNQEPKTKPDISAADVAAAGGDNLFNLREKSDRGVALKVMGLGARALALEAYNSGSVDGVISLGGSGGTSIATSAMQALPIGLPKVMVSTMASGDVAPYVGVKDITMMYSVVDVAGINQISRQIFGNAVGAICGMVEQVVPKVQDKPLIAASMFGVTTPCVDVLRQRMETQGYEVIVFHATGSGGRAMESLINDGFIQGVADITTTEWCDELIGGVLSAGRTRLDAAAKNGIPQVVSLGGLDMVNFGAIETLPSRFKDRNILVHNAQVTLMRTTADESAELGRIIALKLNQSTGLVKLFIPLKGVSIIDAEGQPFYDPVADQALFQAIRVNLDRNKVELIELDNNINDEAFANALAESLLSMLE